MLKIDLSMVSIIFNCLGSGHTNTHSQTRTLRERDSKHSQANDSLTVLLVLYRKLQKVMYMLVWTTFIICLMEYLKSNFDNKYKKISRNNNKKHDLKKQQ